MKLETIIRRIESDDPAIGIGTATAALGILATRLMIKVARKSNLEDIQKESEKIKRKLAKLMREDVKAYKDYMEAYKSKDEEKTEQALKYAIETPMKMAEQGYKILELSKIAVEKGKKSLALEVYGASLLGSATVTAALKIVDINLQELNDHKYEKIITPKKKSLAMNSKYAETEIYFKIFSPRSGNSYFE
ncbi:MAG: cyclodeaminase/cyclohydrolase family protein [Nanoarchaeota archaeon]|nr:cyclodeaminase/cyclohydrolase family protein [Nanoarchaeota archaeon]